MVVGAFNVDQLQRVGAIQVSRAVTREADFVDIDKIQAHRIFNDRQKAFRILRVAADRNVRPAVPGKVKRNHDDPRRASS